VSDTHLGPATNFSPSLFDIFETVSGLLMWGALSDEKSGLNFQFLPGIASAAFLRSEYHETHEYILLSLFWRLTQPGEPGSCIYFPQEQGSPDIPAGNGLTRIKIKDTRLRKDLALSRNTPEQRKLLSILTKWFAFCGKNTQTFSLIYYLVLWYDFFISLSP
jgi:hypothetical protein